jgi:hypothetical protein
MMGEPSTFEMKLEHLKIETRLKDKMFVSVMGEYGLSGTPGLASNPANRQID